MKKSLWIAPAENIGRLRGYLLFGGVYPRLKVFQICVHPDYRLSGTARELIVTLKDFGEKWGYQTITARVASELKANNFWQKSGFHVIRTTPGRGKRRSINVYVLELDVPSLFHTGREPVSSSYDAPSLIGRSIRPLLETPSYVIDLNVFFDVVRKRGHDEAASILSSALKNEIHLFITSEFVNELKRHSIDHTNDPVLEFARRLPTLPKPPSEILNHLIGTLEVGLSKGTPKTGKRLVNDESDLIHLASCIHHRAYGFVTRDSTILRRATDFHIKHGLRIVSPMDLSDSLEDTNMNNPAKSITTGEREISVSDLDDQDRTKVERFLHDLRVDPDDMASWFTSRTAQSSSIRLVMRSTQKIIGVGVWSARPAGGRETVVRLYVDEDHPDSSRAIDYFLQYSMNLGEADRLCRLDLKIGRSQIKTRETALKRGFFARHKQGEGDYRVLSKLSFKGMVTPDNWSQFKRDFMAQTNLELPEQMLEYKDLSNMDIVLSSKEPLRQARISLSDFETLISPGILTCPGRDAVLVPIEERYANELLPQTQRLGSLFPNREAAFRLERAYFSGGGKKRLPPPGAIVVFYVSRTRKEAVAAGRVTFSDALTTTQVELNLRRQGVLRKEEIGEKANKKGEVAVFTFDNLIPFSRSIGFKDLRRMGCVGDANLVTIQPLSSESLRRIVDRASAG